jgi:hypothetical protein
MQSFPTDLSFIDTGRRLEVEATEGGRRSHEFRTSPLGGRPDTEGRDDEVDVAFASPDDVQETQERLDTLDQYLLHAREAFAERSLRYPFDKSVTGDGLIVLPDGKSLARACAGLSGLVGIGDRPAKEFEKRASLALHRLLGGWSVCVGAPRDDGTGPEQAVHRFRQLIPREGGPFYAESYPTNGDLGADAFSILGRTWGGPVVYLQAKNTGFSIRDIPEEFHRASEALQHWFGRRVDHTRRIIPVYAVNTVFTLELKERAFEACGAGNGYHVLDAVDILHVEGLPPDYLTSRDSHLCF